MKKSTKKLATQILAIVLSVLMVVSIAYFTVYMIVENARSEKEEEKQSADAAIEFSVPDLL
ncbi:MAG: hypothetical protein E7663_00625 [Ruminococcaceae bacterium]|nr:hypothetical protein [Oscillospiraceae bacterium]